MFPFSGGNDEDGGNNSPEFWEEGLVAKMLSCEATLNFISFLFAFFLSFQKKIKRTMQIKKVPQVTPKMTPKVVKSSLLSLPSLLAPIGVGGRLGEFAGLRISKGEKGDWVAEVGGTTGGCEGDDGDCEKDVGGVEGARLGEFVVRVGE